MTTHPDFAYKLLTKADRDVLENLGHTDTAVDIADGYVHLSTKTQLAETAMKYFAGETDCLLLEIHVAARGDIKWEPSRGGALFPHIYGKLSKGDETRSWTVDIPENGTPDLPDDLKMTGLYGIATKLVRTLPPEAAHTATIKGLKSGFGPRFPRFNDPILQVTLPKSGLILPNPIGLAAGFDKNAEVFGPMLRFGFGMVECGTVTPKPQAGNPKPRLFRLTQDRAVINRMGFNNDGLESFVRRLSKHNGNGIVGANVGANKISEDRAADYVTGIQAVWPHCQYLTLNISSPNTPGLRGLQNKDSLQDLLTRCGNAVQSAGGDKPVFLKVAPDLDDEAITDICSVIQEHSEWLSGLIVSNTTIERPDSLRSPDREESGGLSGAPLLGPATEILRAFAQELTGEFDLIGVGGVASGADAYAKIKAGAHAVQLYSALVYEGPGLAQKIKRELAKLVKADGFTSVSEAVGSG